MKRRLAALLLCVLPLAGCNTFKVSAFGMPLNEEEGIQLTTEEKLGTILLIGIAVAAAATGVVVAVD